MISQIFQGCEAKEVCKRSLLAHGKLTGYTTKTKTDRLPFHIQTYILIQKRTKT